MDSIGIFIRLVNRNCAKINRTIRSIFRRFYNGQVEKCMQPYFTNTYLFCLEKDATDPTKLHPIGIPTAMWRILANHVASSFRL